jgi:hypothetical protein
MGSIFIYNKKNFKLLEIIEFYNVSEMEKIVLNLKSNTYHVIAFF